MNETKIKFTGKWSKTISCVIKQLMEREGYTVIHLSGDDQTKFDREHAYDHIRKCAKSENIIIEIE